MAANLGELKARIISETVRDDLADDLALQFADMIGAAIREWSHQHFYFNEGRVTLPVTAGVEFVIIPNTILIIDSLWVEMPGGSRWELQKKLMEEIEALAPSTGQPTDWCEFGGGIRLYPAPNIDYGLVIICVKNVEPLIDFTSDVSTNFWIQNGPAQDLIVATVKKRLYRDYLSAVETDPRLRLALVQEAEALSTLTARSNRKIATGRIRPAW